MELEHTLHSLRLRNGRNAATLPAQEGCGPTRRSLEAPQRILLDLLESEQEFEDEVWLRLAGHISSEDIGDVLGRPIYGGSFNRMVAALLPHWTTQWVWADVLRTLPSERGEAVTEEVQEAVIVGDEDVVHGALGSRGRNGMPEWAGAGSTRHGRGYRPASLRAPTT